MAISLVENISKDKALIMPYSCKGHAGYIKSETSDVYTCKTCGSEGKILAIKQD